MFDSYVFIISFLKLLRLSQRWTCWTMSTLVCMAIDSFNQFIKSLGYILNINQSSKLTSIYRYRFNMIHS